MILGTDFENGDNFLSLYCAGSDKGRLQFHVTDGENQTPSETFVIHSRPLILTLKVHTALEVYPHLIQPVTPHHLMTVTNDANQTRPVTYTLQQKPTHGLLVKNINDTFMEVTSFTQDDINNSLIAYHHTTAMSTWNQEDEFVYEVSTAFAKRIKYKTFRISVSYENINEGNKEQLVHISKVMVNEGGEIIINRNDLNVAKLRKMLQASGLNNPEVMYVITKPPSHGLLKIAGTNITEGGRFAQRDVNKGNLIYTHDHSDMLWDVFKFHLEVQTTGGLNRGQSASPRSSITFNITVKPVNDRRFKLEEDYPNLDIVQGFIANITQHELHTSDPDTPPSGLLYEIVNPPNNGILVHRDDLKKPLEAFTQQDINEHKILFMHDGSTQSGAFYFKVSDGRFDPYYKVFNINVFRLTLDVARVKDIFITQGYSSVPLLPENIQVETNGNVLRVLYNITKKPTFGNLYLKDEPVSQFSHEDITAGYIAYIQTNLNSHEDSFEFMVYDMQNYVADKKIYVRVLPQLMQAGQPVTVPPGRPVTLTLDILDASDLARTTNSDPVYIIRNFPRLGRLVKKMQVTVRSKRDAGDDDHKAGNGEPAAEARREPTVQYETRNVPVTNFTHQDIMDETVQYKPSPSNQTAEQPDSFSFLLTAQNAQPAPGKLEFVVEPTHKPPPTTKAPTTGSSGEPTPKSKPSEEKGTAQKPKSGKKGGMGGNHLKVVFIVCGLTVLIIIIFIIVKCCKYQRRKKKQYQMAVEAMEGSKPPLPQSDMYVECHEDLAVEGKQSGESDSRSETSSSYPPRYDSGDQDMEEIQYRSPTALYQANVPHRVPSAPATPAGTRPRSKTPNRSSTPPRSPDLTRAEFSRTVPMCKVTPLVDPDDETAAKAPYSSLKHPGSTDQVTFDWERMDPELLQHCRKTNPVLHQNKYWV